jgi:hypothetical protein
VRLRVNGQVRQDMLVEGDMIYPPVQAHAKQSPATPSTPTATTGATNKKTPADGQGLP